MGLTDYLVVGLFIFVALIILVPVMLFIYLYMKDDKQKQHSILRNFPVIEGSLFYRAYWTRVEAVSI
ncbi:hypothetical protein JCM21738_498 [Mesobacillus boroniphilus JCM 21738]|uniref:Uncharacterized protein n=1 Tax=Mesobacillus boroniphilus JCM 21738 TaxID=1294265 RepID=W4RHC8_9BACI|nr:hypothetical protein JCM21738_498 [Mesobacillus boroniphilus JCM 21738]